MKVALLGATRGCGLAALKLLIEHTTAELYVLVRNTSFAQSPFLNDRVHVHMGDALSAESVRSFLTACGPDLDFIVSSIGGTPVFKPWKPLAAVRFPPGQENICYDSMKILLDELKRRHQPSASVTVPKLIVVSSNAIGKAGHDRLPFALKPLYSHLLKHAHADKMRMECLLHETYGIPSKDFNPSAQPGGPPFKASGVVIVRPSLLTDGASKGLDAIRASVAPKQQGEEGTLDSAWFISRQDVGLFIVTELMDVNVLQMNAPKVSASNRFGRGVVISY